LDSWGFSAGSIHGNKSQGQRERALKSFRSGEISVLVATDVAARGIDIPAVRHVYNYDMPNVPENYVHRIGRTARAGAEGRAMAFCCPAELSEFRAVEKLLKMSIPVAGGVMPPEEMIPAKKGRSGGGGGGRGYQGGGGGGAGGGRPAAGAKPQRRSGGGGAGGGSQGGRGQRRAA
jgi:ATP-dependent RNA helicase RhlE